MRMLVATLLERNLNLMTTGSLTRPSTRSISMEFICRLLREIPAARIRLAKRTGDEMTMQYSFMNRRLVLPSNPARGVVKVASCATGYAATIRQPVVIANTSSPAFPWFAIDSKTRSEMEIPDSSGLYVISFESNDPDAFTEVSVALAQRLLSKRGWQLLKQLAIKMVGNERRSAAIDTSSAQAHRRLKQLQNEADNDKCCDIVLEAELDRFPDACLAAIVKYLPEGKAEVLRCMKSSRDSSVRHLSRCPELDRQIEAQLKAGYEGSISFRCSGSRTQSCKGMEHSASAAVATVMEYDGGSYHLVVLSTKSGEPYSDSACRELRRDAEMLAFRLKQIRDVFTTTILDAVEGKGYGWSQFGKNLAHATRMLAAQLDADAVIVFIRPERGAHHYYAQSREHRGGVGLYVLDKARKSTEIPVSGKIKLTTLADRHGITLTVDPANQLTSVNVVSVPIMVDETIAGYVVAINAPGHIIEPQSTLGAFARIVASSVQSREVPLALRGYLEHEMGDFSAACERATEDAIQGKVQGLEALREIKRTLEARSVVESAAYAVIHNEVAIGFECGVRDAYKRLPVMPLIHKAVELCGVESEVDIYALDQSQNGTVWVDECVFLALMLNLIGNAAKHGNGGRIRIGIARQGMGLRIHIENAYDSDEGEPDDAGKRSGLVIAEAYINYLYQASMWFRCREIGTQHEYETCVTVHTGGPDPAGPGRESTEL